MGTWNGEAASVGECVDTCGTDEHCPDSSTEVFNDATGQCVNVDETPSVGAEGDPHVKVGCCPVFFPWKHCTDADRIFFCCFLLSVLSPGKVPGLTTWASVILFSPMSQTLLTMV